MRSIILSMLLTPLIFITGCGQPQKLFNGHNLNGWKPCLQDPATDPATVWTAQKGVIRCQGKPNGYLRSVQEYSDYQLHVEWRWPENPTNSGVLLHVTGEDKIWPPAIEAQLMNGNAGDLVTIGPGTKITVEGTNYQTPSEIPALVIPKRHQSSEKPAGQWNRYDIICRRDTVRLYVNGVLQNTGTKSSLSRGSVCLQSEGSPIEFRNIVIKPIDIEK